MSVYELDFDEAVILQDTNVTMNGKSVTLILTNRNIIQVNKGFFGGDKDANKYPLLELKELNGKPNVRVGKSKGGEVQLELYFQGYDKAYSIKGILSERKWATAIEKAYKAAVAEAKKANKSPIGIGSIFNPLKGTIENAKKSMIKTKTIKCPNCGNILSGEKGKEVKCDYCDFVVKIK